MANEQDLFDPRSMTEALIQRKKPNMFLRDLFFGTVKTHATRHVDIHVKKGKRRLAPYVAPDSQGKVVERIGHDGETFTPPYLKPKMVTTAADLLKPTIGEKVYMDGNGNVPAVRAAKLLAEDMAELDDMIDRREELQSSEALFGGVVTIKGEGIDTTIDFGIPADNKAVLTGTDAWDDAASTPYQNLKDWKYQIRKASGENANICVFGREATDSFINSADLKDKLDTRRLDLGTIVPEDLGTGVTFVGDVKSLGLEIWSYDEWYIDEDTGLETELVPSKEIMMTSKTAMRKRHYRVIEDTKAGNFVSQRFAKSWEEEDPSARILMVQSGPLCVPHQVDALFNATVLE